MEILKCIFICGQLTSLVNLSLEGAFTKAFKESLVKEAAPSLKNTTVAIPCDQRL